MKYFCVAAIAVLSCEFASRAAADPIVALNPAIVDVSGASSVADMRYRISATNWDQLMNQGTNVVPASIVQTNNLGSAAAINNVIWALTVNYDHTSGYSFSLQNDSKNGGNPYTVSWTSPHNSVSPTSAFNAIQIYAKAGPLKNATSMSMAVTDLLFSGLATTGSLTDMHADTPGTIDASQWLVANGDLSTTDWTLTAKVQGSFAGGSGSGIDERLKVDIITADGVVAVPEPYTVVSLGAMALFCLAVGQLRRRFVGNK